jgi:hypothetical protein
LSGEERTKKRTRLARGDFVLVCRLDRDRLFVGVVTKLEEFLYARRRLLLRLRRLYRLKLRIGRSRAY